MGLSSRVLDDESPASIISVANILLVDDSGVGYLTDKLRGGLDRFRLTWHRIPSLTTFHRRTLVSLLSPHTFMDAWLRICVAPAQNSSTKRRVSKR